MRIGINTLYLVSSKSGGAYVYLANFLPALAEVDKKNEYFIFVNPISKDFFHVNQTNFHYILVNAPVDFQPYRVLIENIFIPLLIKKYKIDVFHSPADALPLWIPCKSIMMLRNLIYFHFHELYPIKDESILRKLYIFSQLWYYRFATKYSVKRADKVVAVSQNTKKELVSSVGVEKSKVSVVYHGISDVFKKPYKPETVKELKAKLGIDRYILYVAALSPYKNHDKIIRAFHILKEEHHIPHKFVAVGSIPSHSHASYLRQLVADLNIESEVLFIDYLPHEQLVFLYRGADAFVFPSSCESFGIPVLEAMACGVPVVASNRSSVPEIVGDAGLIVDPDDANQFANAIESVLFDNELRTSLINKGFARAKQFSWERTAREMCKIYEELYENNDD